MADGGIDLDELTWTAPGPGLWRHDPGHFPDPATGLFAELFSPAFAAGTARSNARYGSPIHHGEYPFVNRYSYGQGIAVAQDEVEDRVATATRALAEAQWDVDLEWWDREVKPASIRRHLELQAVDSNALGDEALAAHLTTCIDHYRVMVEQHHTFNTPATFPLAEFVLRTTRWTGLAPTEILPLLHGASPVSRGGGTELLEAADAFRSDAEARRELARSKDLHSLRSLDGAAGAAVARYLELAGHRIANGFDFVNPTGVELPSVMRSALERAVDHTEGDDTRAADAAAEIRVKVPPPDRADFDESLATARRMWRLRDERGVYSDAWAAGILRLAFLAAGRRLAGRRSLEDPAHLFEATRVEVPAIAMGDASAPDRGELASRAALRARLARCKAPATLGTELPPLPYFAQWPQRFTETIGSMGMLMAAHEPAATEESLVTVTGLGANPGVCEGRARVVTAPEDVALVEPDDILVMRTTSEAICVVVPLLAGIVTDHGGLLTHAAIVAREVGFPAVVGCGNATTAIADGDLIRIDGGVGEVTILERRAQ